MSDKITHHSLPVTRTAHYATLGNIGKHIKTIWMVCHGYGQLSKTFIKRFIPIMDEETFVVAPEGLSRFYWGGFDGPVVASWMTREDRLDEIQDYSTMMSQLYDQYVPQCDEDVNIILLGFSQGTATQVRWIMDAFPKFNHLILWAGQLPEDLDYNPVASYFKDKKLHFAYGDEDPFITPKRKEIMEGIIKDSGLPFQEYPFVGVHKVEREAIKNWKDANLLGLEYD